MLLGPVMIGLSGFQIDADEREMLMHPLVGGVVLFSRNYESIEQLQALVEELHQLRDPHLLVAVDHEGGRVQRFRTDFTVLPAIGQLGKVYQRDRHQARKLSQLSGWLMAAELRAVGIDFSFAPVLDLDKGVSQIIGDRAFAADPECVTDLARYYIRGMHEAGMAATGKHFPGHGSVVADSHLALPVDKRRYEDIQFDDLIPFEHLCDNSMEAMMIAHVLYENIDSQLAGFSRFWLRDVLRQRLGFQGLIFSDDLEMEGASVAGTVPERAERALAAGCDVVLVCQTRQAMASALEGMGPYYNPAAQLRMVRMHGRPAPKRVQLRADPRWQQAVERVQAYDEPHTLDLI
jgi:beta-N-acetylhexosaminidase